MFLRRWRITGQVQGVGFRPFVYRQAQKAELGGSVWNDSAGVVVEVWGTEAQLVVFVQQLRDEVPPLATIDQVTCELTREMPSSSNAPKHFTIVESDQSPLDRGRITIDSAVCDDCLDELFQKDDRRHCHPLINCTNCGPRYSIVRDLPYDRPQTTMAEFAICDVCQEEYLDPGNRRFHAQPICCPSCGPVVSLVNHEGIVYGGGEAFSRSARLLRDGKILAMKGLGGYHLVVDATNEAAVRELRQRKKRDYKPLAVMVRDLQQASSLAEVSDEAAALMRSPIAPIVLLLGISPSSIAASVTQGSHRVGLMIPNTPMQHLLLAEPMLTDRPLVMTSANLSDDPLIKDDEEAQRHLAGIADAYLLHDRPIERAIDDSIVMDTEQGLIPIRRARGYVPTPLPLPIRSTAPGLCVGADLKNAVCMVNQDNAVLSQHIGDLNYSLAYQRFEKAIEDLLRLYDIKPQWIACDLHPRYLSHRYAKRYASQVGIDLIQIQHHYAHLASLLAEHNRTDRIVCLACDGVGYGDDGTAWGGEILVGDLQGYERCGRIRPLRLPGGDQAAVDIPRCALSWMYDLLGGESVDHPHAQQVISHASTRYTIGQMLQRDVNCPPSSGLGRLFDAAASLLGLCDHNHYQAMSGMLLEAAAESCTNPLSGKELIRIRKVKSATGQNLLELDHRPLLMELMKQIILGKSSDQLAWLFHDALAEGLSRSACQIARQRGIKTIGLTGGVFCNALLSRLVIDYLRELGFEILIHHVVPPNDGGIALGQAAVAGATLNEA